MTQSHQVMLRHLMMMVRMKMVMKRRQRQRKRRRSMSGPGCVVVHGGQMAPKAGSCLIDFFFFFLSDTETSSNVHTWRSRDTAARQVSGLQIEARRRAAILWTLTLAARTRRRQSVNGRTTGDLSREPPLPRPEGEISLGGRCSALFTRTKSRRDGGRT